MSVSLLEELIERAERLPPDQRLRLIAHLAENVRHAFPEATPRRQGREIRGILPTALVWTVLISNYIFKVGVEVVFTPVTYVVVNFLKRAEREDYYDRDTAFNPFAVEQG